MGKIDWEKLDNQPQYKCPNCGYEGSVFMREIVSGQPFCTRCGHFADEIRLPIVAKQRSEAER